MPDVLIRNIPPEVIQRLKERAKENGRSLQAELREVLTEAGGGDWAAAEAALERAWEAVGERSFSDSTELIREDRAR